MLTRPGVCSQIISLKNSDFWRFILFLPHLSSFGRPVFEELSPGTWLYHGPDLFVVGDDVQEVRCRDQVVFRGTDEGEPGRREGHAQPIRNA